MLPQAKEGDLSPHFNEETSIGMLFIDRPISFDMCVLVKKLSIGLIWDPICSEERSSAPIPPFTAVLICFFEWMCDDISFSFSFQRLYKQNNRRDAAGSFYSSYALYIFCFAWLTNGAEIEAYPKIESENSKEIIYVLE